MPVQLNDGTVRIKMGALDGTVLQQAPEFEDVHRIAMATGRPVSRVQWDALMALHSGGQGEPT